MTVQKFKSTDFETYQSWFLDELVKKYLGNPPDAEWLRYILTDKEGVQYTFFEAQKMVGVMGIVLPDQAHPHYYITDIVVNPKWRNKGIGRQMLDSLQALHPLTFGQSYKAFVDIKNKKAQLFFKKLDWQLMSEQPDEDEMLSFTFQTDF